MLAAEALLPNESVGLYLSDAAFRAGIDPVATMGGQSKYTKPVQETVHPRYIYIHIHI